MRVEDEDETRGHEKATREYRFSLVREQLVNDLNDIYQ